MIITEQVNEEAVEAPETKISCSSKFVTCARPEDVLQYCSHHMARVFGPHGYILAKLNYEELCENYATPRMT